MSIEWKCNHAPSGCNYPEGECAGLCETTAKSCPPCNQDCDQGRRCTANTGEIQAEAVAWRPILQHPIPWVTGKPQESDIRHWTSQDCEIEYAYTHPAQPVQPAVAVNEQFAVLIKKANDQAEHFEREWYLRGDELEALEQVNAQLLEALKELMYARTDKAEGMAEAAIAAAEAEKARGRG